MNIYQIIITDKLIDFGENKTFEDKIVLNFISKHHRDTYLHGYLYPFLQSYEQIDNKQIWGWTGENNFKVEYSFELKEFELEIITHVPLKHERKEYFEKHKLLQYGNEKKTFEEKLKYYVENPLRERNEHCSPTQFDLNFPKLSIF